MSTINIEVCINAADHHTVRAAVAAAYTGGASTIELCRDMHLEGLTPATDLIEVARTAFGQRRGLMVMIRPRAGDFSYTAAERKTMQQQILAARRAGADGVVLGILRHGDCRVDTAAMRPLIETAAELGLTVTFHRAFDAAPDAPAALEEIAELGCQRLLTSGLPWGQPGSALDGVERLGQLVGQARQRLEVVIAGGVTPLNAGEILHRVAASGGRIGLHAYSGARAHGSTTVASVRALVGAVRAWETRNLPGSS
jgi:copper homeostasis protein